jgi:hypothetical protein
MKQMTPAIQARRQFLALALPTVASLLHVSCSSASKAKNAMTFRMGERASVGKLIYNVTHSEWKTVLGEGSPSPRIPEHRFLILELSITNSGGEPAPVPLLHVFDASGKQYREVDSGEYVDGWMGLLRVIGSTETRAGSIVFDVAPASYKLQVTDGADAENELIAYVDVPFQMDADPVLAQPPAIAPPGKQ